MRRIKRDGSDILNDKVFLHVQIEKLIERKFHEFPDYADRHGEAESYDRQIQRCQIQGMTFPVQDIHKGEADGRAQETVNRVQHGVPSGDRRVIMVDFAQYFRRVDKQINDAFKQRRDIQFQTLFKERGQQKQKKRQQTKRKSFIVLRKKAADRGQNHQNPQNGIKNECFPVEPDAVSKILHFFP